MQGVRADRISDLIKKEVADILTKRIRDPRVGFVTVTRAQVSNDLRNASVSVSVHDERNEKRAISALKKASGFVRGELARRLPLRRIPALTFIPDRMTDKVSHLLGVLEQVEEEETHRHQKQAHERPEPPVEGAL